MSIFSQSASEIVRPEELFPTQATEIISTSSESLVWDSDGDVFENRQGIPARVVIGFLVIKLIE